MRRLAKLAWRCQRGKAYNNNNLVVCWQVTLLFILADRHGAIYFIFYRFLKWILANILTRLVFTCCITVCGFPE